MIDISLPLIGLICIVIFLVLMFLKMHIGISMMIAGLLGIILSRGLSAGLQTLSTTVYRVSASEYLAVIPLFVLMGILAGNGGVSEDAFKSFNKWVGHLPGGLAMAAVSACAAFGAVCGDNIATAATMCKVALPQMRKYGYSDQLALGSIAAGGNLGILIPPSTAFIVYGFVTQTPIGSLFISGIVPGIVLTMAFLVLIFFLCKLNPRLASRAPRTSWKERLISLKGLWGIIFVFIMVMGGLLTGWFTPSEAGSVGAAAVVIVMFISRKFSFKAVGTSLLESVSTTAMILLLIFGAMLFSHFLTTTEIAQMIADFIRSANLHPYVVLAIILVIYVILGFFMDIWAILIVTLPIFFPLIAEAGFDPLQFGVLSVLCIMIGCITPPVGVVVFALSGMVRDVPMYTIFKGCYPFLFVMLIIVVILMFAPSLSTWLPDLMIPAR
jgi:tripartite ATP-independent transporter DctM subunit